MTGDILLGNRLKKIRKDNKLSQSEVAAYLGTEQSNLSRYENNERMPDTVILERLSNLYGCNPDYFTDEYAEYEPVKVHFRAKIKEQGQLQNIALINRIVLNLKSMRRMEDESI